MNVDCEAMEVEGEARRRGVRTKGMPMCRGRHVVEKGRIGGASMPEISLRLLRKPLLINPSAVIRKRNDEPNNEWKRDWHKTERGKRTRKIDNTTPSVRFLKTISNVKLSRQWDWY